eukprot:1153410-Pelagomonas_calceolata.AAC.2
MLCARANRSRERAAALERYTAAEHSPGMVATAIASMQGKQARNFVGVIGTTSSQVCKHLMQSCQKYLFWKLLTKGFERLKT